MAKNKKRSSTETARRIWLAGIGAYGRAFVEAQEALKDVTGKSSEVFDDLVMKGQMIEKTVEIKSKDMMDKAQIPAMPAIPAMPDLNIDERIKRMRSRLNRSDDADVHSLEARVAELEAKLDEVLERLEPKAKTPAKKIAPPKTPSKPKTSVKTQRTPKKTVAEKMADKKASIAKS